MNAPFHLIREAQRARLVQPLSPRKAYRRSTCPYERRIARKSYGMHAVLEHCRWTIRQYAEVLILRPDDDYACDEARHYLRHHKTNYRVRISELSRRAKPELP